MATREWLGRAAARPQLTTLTPGGTIAAGSTFTVTINGKAVVATSAGATVADATAALAAALEASAEPEFAEVAWTDATTHVLGTGPADGTPFALTETAGGSGSPTLLAATPQTATGPNDWNNALNWSGGAVPVTGDDVVIDVPVPILDGLNQTTVVLASLTFGANFTRPGAVGRPDETAGGSREYRDTHLRVGVSGTVTVRDTGERVRLDLDDTGPAVNVFGTGPADGTGPALAIRRPDGATVHVISGSVGLSTRTGEAGIVGELHLGGGDQGGRMEVAAGAGLVVEYLTVQGGELTLSNGVSGPARQTGGTVRMTGGHVTGGLAIDGGVWMWMGDGTITGVEVGSDGTLDLSRDPRPKTFAGTVRFHGRSRVVDPGFTANWSATTVHLVRCGLSGGDAPQLDLGEHLRITVEAGV